MTAFNRKDGLLDEQFDDPTVDALFRSIKREIELQTTIFDRLVSRTEPLEALLRQEEINRKACEPLRCTTNHDG